MSTFFPHMTNEEMYDEIENRILRCVEILMYRNSPQDQLLAGGELLILLEICIGADYNLRRKLSENNRLCAKAFDFVSELRHWNCKALIERNKTLYVKRQKFSPEKPREKRYNESKRII